MRHYILILCITILTSLSCRQKDTKQKELELKVRELALKEKEFESKLNETKSINDKAKSSKISDNTVSENKNTINADLNNLQIPDGYRFPTNDDINKTPDWKAMSKQGTKYAQPYYSQGDFNGDGINDKAYILIKINSKEKSIFAFLSQDREFKPNLIAKDVVVGIYRINKGENVCLYDDDGYEIKSKKTLKFDAIGFSDIDAGDPGAYVFNQSNGKFEVYFACINN